MLSSRPFHAFHPQHHDAFQHGTYGDFITVERKIGSAGFTSSYALKDATGRRAPTV